MNHQTKILPIICAAGGSHRLGSPKQLIKHGEYSLLTKVIETARNADLANPLVILGGYADDIIAANTLKNVDICINEKWQEGLGETIRFGVKKASSYATSWDAIMILLCDQIFLNTKLLKELKSNFEKNPNKIVACQYDTVNYGPPVIFPKSFWPQIKNSSSFQGAKHIINANFELVNFIKFPKGNVDIDTPLDLENFFKNHSLIL